MYYNILIETNEIKEICEFDLDLNNVNNDFVLPYFKNEEITIDGFFIDPTKIIRFIIIQSEFTSTEIFNSELSKLSPTEIKPISKIPCIFIDKLKGFDVTKKIFAEVKNNLAFVENQRIPKTQSPNNRTIFLGYSYKQIDDEFVSGFKDLLCANGWNVIDGKADGLGSISEAIIDKISISHIVVIVMTKRDEKANGNYTTSSWLLEEKGAALALKKQVGMFVEEGIDDCDIGGIQGDNQRFPFNRNNFLKVAMNFINILRKQS